MTIQPFNVLKWISNKNLGQNISSRFCVEVNKAKWVSNKGIYERTVVYMLFVNLIYICRYIANLLASFLLYLYYNRALKIIRTNDYPWKRTGKYLCKKKQDKNTLPLKIVSRTIYSPKKHVVCKIVFIKILNQNMILIRTWIIYFFFYQENLQSVQ